MKIKIYYSCIFFVLIIIGPLSSVYASEFELESLNILVRHGDRVPDKREVYDEDPFKSEIFEKIGYGQLTEVGKQRMFRFGQVLRRKYKFFLSSLHPNEVYAYHTYYNRNKVTLQKVLAGLYPEFQIKNDTDSWSKIHMYSNSSSEDFFLNYLTGKCPKLWPLVHEGLKTPKMTKKLTEYEDLFEYLEKSTGMNMTNGVNALFLYGYVKAVKSMNLPLPKWCSKEVYKKLLDIMALAYDVLTFNENFRRIGGGPIIQEFLGNMQHGKKQHYGKQKIFIYAAHEINIATFIRAQNLTNAPSRPEYGDAILVEKFRRWDRQVFIRVLYWDASFERFIRLKLKNCRYECPFHSYKKIASHVLPRPDDCKI